MEPVESSPRQRLSETSVMAKILRLMTPQSDKRWLKAVLLAEVLKFVMQLGLPTSCSRWKMKNLLQVLSDDEEMPCTQFF